MLRHFGCPITDPAPWLHIVDGAREPVATELWAQGVTEAARPVAMRPGASVKNSR
jgi:hypothetical protein